MAHYLHLAYGLEQLGISASPHLPIRIRWTFAPGWARRRWLRSPVMQNADDMSLITLDVGTILKPPSGDEDVSDPLEGASSLRPPSGPL